MDKQIQSKKKKNKRYVLGGLGILFLGTVLFLNATRKKRINLEANDVRITEVRRGDFEDVVLFNSTVEPKTSVLVNVIQGGSVAEVFVETGQLVKKGTPLLRVYNPNAELNYLTQETAIVEQINNLRNLRVNIKNQQLNLDQQLLSIGNDYETAKRQYNVDTLLYDKGYVARLDYEKSQQEFEFQKERNSVIKSKATEESKSRDIQLMRINTSLKNMQKSLELLRSNKENFVVKAPADGLLSSFNPILGESYAQGQSIGKIDVLDGYKLMAKVDEYYISRLREGIAGSVTVDNQTYAIDLRKIHPEVVQGQFKVELQFANDSLPNSIKRGMSLKSKMFLSDNSQALLITKGPFYHNTGGKWAFVLDSDNKAVKRPIKIGRENPFYYEILEGLQEGDRLITSNYDEFETMEEIHIN